MYVKLKSHACQEGDRDTYHVGYEHGDEVERGRAEKGDAGEVWIFYLRISNLHGLSLCFSRSNMEYFLLDFCQKTIGSTLHYRFTN